MPYLDSGCLWVEDKPENAVVGAKLGLTALLIEHYHNVDFVADDVIKVKNWKEIYEMVV